MAISRIESNKSPWSDRFSSQFFKNTWNVIGCVGRKGLTLNAEAKRLIVQRIPTYIKNNY